MATSTNVSTPVGFKSAVNVTCKKGHRAVPRNFTGVVSCDLPTSYVISCGICGWIQPMECRQIMCVAPRGKHVQQVSQSTLALGSTVIVLGSTTTVTCGIGYMVAEIGRNLTKFPIFPNNQSQFQCQDHKYEAMCNEDCQLEPLGDEWRVTGSVLSCQDLAGWVGNHSAVNTCDKISEQENRSYFCNSLVSSGLASFGRSTNKTALEACCVCGGGLGQQLVRCQAASCPPFASFGFAAVQGQSIVKPLDNGTQTDISCPAGFRFDSDFGPGNSIVTCGSDCRYTRNNMLTGIGLMQFNTTGMNGSALSIHSTATKSNVTKQWQNDFLCRPAGCQYQIDRNSHSYIHVNFSVEPSGMQHSLPLKMNVNSTTLKHGDLVSVKCLFGYRSSNPECTNSSCAVTDETRISVEYNVLCTKGITNDTRQCVPMAPCLYQLDKNANSSVKPSGMQQSSLLKKNVNTTTLKHGDLVAVKCLLGYRSSTPDCTNSSCALPDKTRFSVEYNVLCTKGITNDTQQCVPMASCLYQLDKNANSSVQPSGMQQSSLLEKNVDAVTLNSGDLVAIKCLLGYRSSNLQYINSSCTLPDEPRISAEYTVQCTEGITNDTQQCVPVVCPPLDTDDIHLVSSVSLYGNSINITCENGYQFNSSSAPGIYTATCLDTCDYDIAIPDIPKCVISSCSLPSNAHWPVLKNASGRLFHASGRLFHQESIDLECDFGYVLLPRQQITYTRSALAENASRCNTSNANCTALSLAEAPAKSAADVAADEKAYSIAIEVLTNETCNQSATVTCNNGILDPPFMCLPRMQRGCPTKPCLYPSANTIETKLGPNIQSWVIQPTPPYGVDNYWAHGSEFPGNQKYANHMVNLSIKCSDGYLAMALDTNGTALPKSVHCNTGGAELGSSYASVCAHGSFQVAGTCVPIECPMFGQDSWDPQTKDITPMATVIHGNGRGINVSCNTGYRPSEVSPADVFSASWHLAVCDTKCSYSPLPCERVSCNKVLPPHAHVIAGPVLPAYTDNFIIECDFGYHMMLISQSAGAQPYLPGKIKLYFNPRCKDQPGWYDAVTPHLGCSKYMSTPQGKTPGYMCGTSVDQQSEDAINGMAASEACCICGGGIRPEFCITNLEVNCVDGAVLPAASCLPIMSCGCGTAPCTASNTTFGANVKNFSAQPVAAYGPSFWADGPYFEQDHSRVHHKVKLTVECDLGFRASFKTAVTASSCSAARTFGAECKDCEFMFSQECRPVVCPAYQSPTVSYIETHSVVQSSDYTQSITPNTPGIFSDMHTVACVNTSRALPIEPSDMPLDACSAPRTYTATCNDSCSWDFARACQPVYCPGYLASHVQGTTSTIHGKEIEVVCAQGYRAGNSAPNSSQSFNVTCLTDCSYTAGVDCVPVTCGALTLQRVTLQKSDNLGPTFMEQYWDEYPYTLNQSSAAHLEHIVVSCNEGFRGEAGMQQASASFETFEVECWDSTFLPSTPARCVPRMCPSFNYAGTNSSANNSLGNSNSTNQVHDPHATWNISTGRGYGTSLNITCKPGYRAVPIGFSGQVKCSEPTW